MMPYPFFQLYQIERPKSAAEIRSADEQAGKAAASISLLWHRASKPTGVARAPHRGRLFAALGLSAGQRSSC
jgi:hypothetical protein